MLRVTLLLLALLSSLWGFNAQASADQNIVVNWNQQLLKILHTPGAQPATVHPTRSFAMLHVAIFDAVNAIELKYRPYLQSNGVSDSASAEAAANSAAYNLLLTLYPAQKESLAKSYADAQALLADNDIKSRGISVGELTAKAVLNVRSADNANATPSVYSPESNPGAYQLTPPDFKAAVFTHWSKVTPFTLYSANQFRPGFYPKLTSNDYITALNQVNNLGKSDSTTRSADQTVIARFWSAPAQNYWNEIAQTLIQKNGLPLLESARLFALLNLGLADATISLYEAKYFYNLWRPITPLHLVDANWSPLLNTPLDPTYPGAHSVISAAAATILGNFFKTDTLEISVNSEILPTVQRSFKSLTDAAAEAGLSRTFAGAHFSFDDQAGQDMGKKLAHFVLSNYLTPNEISSSQDHECLFKWAEATYPSLFAPSCSGQLFSNTRIGCFSV